MVKALYQTQRKVIAFKNNPVEFLNGITSNDMSAANNAFLNIHGKIVATFAQTQISEDEIWICVEEDFVDAVINHTRSYAKLARVEVSTLNHSVYFDLDATYAVGSGEVAIAQKAGQLILTVKALPADVSDDEFKAFRIKNNIPVLGVDYNDDFILNVSADDFVSFTKGCYLGQEPVSKVHSRSKPTWKLVVKKEADCSKEEKEKMTSKVKDRESNETLGFVFVKNDE